MKVLSVAVFSMPFGFIQTAAGISCGSHCAACWKTGEPGVDIKIGCDGSFVSCHDCPPGYESIHCAKSERCQCQEPNCQIFGPCYCGVTEIPGKKRCTIPGPGAQCTS